MSRRVIPSQKLRDFSCVDPQVQKFVNDDLRQHVAEVYQQFVKMLTGFFDFSRTNAAATITASANVPAIRLIETDAAANEEQWEIQSVAGVWQLVTQNDDGTAGATAIAIDRSGTTVSSIALTATAVTLNGVAASDFARLSQANAFTAVGNATAGPIYLDSTTPLIGFRNSGGGSDAKRWINYVSGNDFLLAQTRDDAGISSANSIVITRSGVTVTSIALTATAITLDGATTVGANGATPTHRLNTNSATTVGAAGGASALPATPTGYIIINVNGTDRKIPYYAT